jgi:hypothetical protein
MYINKTILQDNKGNAIRLSKVKEFDSKIMFNGVSIKYLLSGLEHYRINQKKYTLCKNEFVSGNNTDYTSVIVQSFSGRIELNCCYIGINHSKN